MQKTLFNKDKINDWKQEWLQMPEYNNVKQPKPLITATFKFRNKEDYDYFHKIVKEKLYNNKKVFDGMQTKDKKQSWFPLNEKASNYEYR